MPLARCGAILRLSPFPAILAAAAIGVALAADDAKEAGKTGAPAGSPAPPPLVVDEDEPLLLDEPAEPEKAPAKTAEKRLADNGACFVCHVNYRGEELAVRHAGEGVGCADCHGPSHAHCNDENNTTPPDTLYPAAAIGKACGACHDSHDVPAVQVIARWLKRCATKTDPSTIVCTDCHGEHRLKLRSVRWDKKTRHLLPPAAGGRR